MSFPVRKSQELTDMIEEVYEEETSLKGWDSSFIESVREFYYEKGYISQKQYEAVKRKYDRMNDQTGSTYAR